MRRNNSTTSSFVYFLSPKSSGGVVITIPTISVPLLLLRKDGENRSLSSYFQDVPQSLEWGWSVVLIRERGTIVVSDSPLDLGWGWSPWGWRLGWTIDVLYLKGRSGRSTICFGRFYSRTGKEQLISLSKNENDKRKEKKWGVERKILEDIIKVNNRRNQGSDHIYSVFILGPLSDDTTRNLEVEIV